MLGAPSRDFRAVSAWLVGLGPPAKGTVSLLRVINDGGDDKKASWRQELRFCSKRRRRSREYAADAFGQPLRALDAGHFEPGRRLAEPPLSRRTRETRLRDLRTPRAVRPPRESSQARPAPLIFESHAIQIQRVDLVDMEFTRGLG